MAYATTLRMVKGDTLPELTLTLKDSNTAASGQVLDQENSDTFANVDITGGTVRIRTVAYTHLTLPTTLPV